MATNVIPAHSGQAKPTRVQLLAIRAALVTRINAAATIARMAWDHALQCMPAPLFAAGCYLAAHGLTDQACPGERIFNIAPTAYRGFSSHAEMVDFGRKALFVGDDAIAPVVALQVAA